MNQAIDRETFIQAETQKPYTGYFVISHQVMQGDGFVDFLFDNFQLVAETTTVADECNNQVRFILRSPLFGQGFGQYAMDVEREKDNYRRILSIKRINQ